MRTNATLANLDPFRLQGEFHGDTSPGDMHGTFRIPLGDSDAALVISSGIGDEWEHVSVSLPDRCPTWEEMEKVRTLFFRPTEWVLQFSPPRAKKINIHPFCLHLWRMAHGTPPHPPEECV